MGNIYSDEISNSIKYLDAHPDDTPDVGVYIGHFLKCSQAGGVFDQQYCVDNIRSLCKKIIRRIKEQGVISDDNDPLFRCIRECGQAAIDGVDIPTKVIDFTSLVAGYYLNFKKGQGKIVSYNSQTLANIYRERRNVLNNGFTVNETVTRLLDYTEANTRCVGRIELSDRYNEKEAVTYGPYYSLGTDDERYLKLMLDVKYYIYPQEFKNAIESCKKNIPLDKVPVYVQSIILLEFKQPFPDIFNFIKKNAGSYANAIFNEIVKYSKKGIDFYRYVSDKQNHMISKKEEEKLNIIRKQNNLHSEELRRRNNVSPSLNINLKYDSTIFESRKKEQEYLNEQTARFILSRFAESNQRNAIIFIDYERFYALSSITDPKKALVNLYQFHIGLSKSRTDDEVRRFYESLKGDCEVGYPFIEIANKNGVLDIRSHLPRSLSDCQIEQLNTVMVLLRNASRAINKKASNNISQNEIERCIKRVTERIRRSKEDDEIKLKELYRRNKKYNPNLFSKNS